MNCSENSNLDTSTANNAGTITSDFEVEEEDEQLKSKSSTLFGCKSTQLWIVFIIMGVGTQFMLGLVDDVVRVVFYYWFTQMSDGKLSLTTLDQNGQMVYYSTFIIEMIHYCIFTLIAGRYGIKLGGAFKVFLLGFTFLGSALIFNGLIPNIRDHRIFAVMFFELGIVRVIGETAINVMSIAVVTFQFSEYVGTCFGFLRMIYALTRIHGSRQLSYYLLNIGNNSTFITFGIFGCLLLLFAAISFIFLHKYEFELSKNRDNPNSQDSQENLIKHGFKDLLNLRTTQISLVVIFCAAFSMGYYARAGVIVIYYNREKLAGIEDTDTLLVFYHFVSALLLSLPITGFLCDKQFDGIRVLIAGLLATCLGSLIIGPLTTLLPNIWLYISGQTLWELGRSIILVSSLVIGLNGAWQKGFPRSFSTNALVIGLWEAGFGSGLTLGSFTAEFLLRLYTDNDNNIIINIAVFPQLIAILVAMIIAGVLIVFKEKISSHRMIPTTEC